MQRKTFLKELEAIIRLRSPPTVNIYGAITSREDSLVLVMELLVGGDLHAVLKRSEGPLPVEHARRIIRDVCEGLAFLHSKLAVHGDIKSANVLFDGAGRAKVRPAHACTFVEGVCYASCVKPAIRMVGAQVSPAALQSVLAPINHICSSVSVFPNWIFVSSEPRAPGTAGPSYVCGFPDWRFRDLQVGCDTTPQVSSRTRPRAVRSIT